MNREEGLELTHVGLITVHVISRHSFTIFTINSSMLVLPVVYSRYPDEGTREGLSKCWYIHT